MFSLPISSWIPIPRGSLSLYSLLWLILALYLLIMQATTWVFVPSNTLPSLLWVVATKTILFRDLLYINATMVFGKVVECGGSYHPSNHVRANPLLKLFLYSVATSCNVPLTWPWPASPTLPSECMDSSKLYWPLRPRVWHVAWLNFCTPQTYFMFILSFRSNSCQNV